MRTADICPTCSTYINALCVLFDGPLLTTLDIAPLDDLDTALVKIEAWALSVNALATVVDTPYGPGWDGSTDVPTQNAIYDAFVPYEGAISAGATRVVVGTGTGIEGTSAFEFDGNQINVSGDGGTDTSLRLWGSSQIGSVTLNVADPTVGWTQTLQSDNGTIALTSDIQTLSLGSDKEVPFMNATNDDLSYDSDFIYNTSSKTLTLKNGVVGTALSGQTLRITDAAGAFIELDYWNNKPALKLYKDNFGILLTNNLTLTADREVTFQDKAGTIALTDDIGYDKTGYTVATLPGTPSQGDRTFVTDATATTFYSIVAGGGANVVPVFYNGTNWVIA